MPSEELPKPKGKKRGRKKKEELEVEKKKNHYVDSKVFEQCICTFYKSKDLTNELAGMVSKMANQLSFAPNFINYSFKDEMVGDAIVKMIAALNNKKFNPKKGNPFSYFTKIAFNAFRNRIKKERKIHETMMNYQEETYNRLAEEGYISQGKKDRAELEIE